MFGIAPAIAIGTDLWFAAGTERFAARLHRDRGLIDWQVVRRLWRGSLPASEVTLMLLHFQILRADIGILKMAVAVAVILTALGFLFQGRLHAVGRRWPLGGSARLMRIQGPLTVLAGMVLGAMVTLTSIGAGAFGAVTLAAFYPLRLTPAKLIATDIMHAIPLGLFAGLGHLLFGHVDVGWLFWLLTGSIPGVLLGAYCSSRLPRSVLCAMPGRLLLLVGGMAGCPVAAHAACATRRLRR